MIPSFRGVLAALLLSIPFASGAASPPDAFEAMADNSAATYNLILKNEQQAHTFHAPTDEDWIRFQVMDAGLPHTVRLRQSGDIDAVLEIHFADGSILTIDEEGPGAGAEEIWTSLNPPLGVHLIRVRATGAVGAESGYELQFTGDWGESVGVGQIGRKTITLGRTFEVPRGTTLSGDTALRAEDRRTMDSPCALPGLYPKTKIAGDAGAFPADHYVTITAPWDLLNPNAAGEPGTRPWSAAWTALHPRNATVTEIVLANGDFTTAPPNTFAPPLRLTLEMMNDTTAWGGAAIIDDIPPGTSTNNATVYVWDGSAWQVHDTTPTCDGPGRTATTNITAPIWVDTTLNGIASKAMIYAVVPTGAAPQPTPTPCATPEAPSSAGQVVRTFIGKPAASRVVALTGSLAAVLRDGYLDIYDHSIGAVVRQIPGARADAASRDGLLIEFDGGVIDVPTGRLTGISASSMALARGSKRLFVARRSGVSQNLFERLADGSEAQLASGLSFSAELLDATDSGSHLALADPAGQLVIVRTAPFGMTPIATTPAGVGATAISEQADRIAHWDLSGIRAFNLAGAPAWTRADLIASQLTFSPDGSLLLFETNSGSGGLLNSGTGTSMPYFSHSRIDSDFSATGMYSLKGARFYDEDATGTPLSFMPFDSMHSAAFRWEPDSGSVLGHGENGNILRYSTGMGQPIVDTGISPQGNFAFTSDGSKVISLSGNLLNEFWLREFPSGTIIHSGSFPEPSDMQLRAVNSTGTRVAAITSAGRAVVYDPSNPAVAQLSVDLPSTDYRCHFVDAAGSQLLVRFGTSPGRARIYQVGTGTMVADWALPVFTTHWNYSLEAGLVAVVGGDPETITLRNPFTGAVVETYPGAVGSMLHPGFSMEGNWLLVPSATPDIRVFDRATGQKIVHTSLPGHTSLVTASEDRKEMLLFSSTGSPSVREVIPPRAIIVAGGGNYPGNGIAAQTDALGAYAYQVLKARGYTPENILYLSAFEAKDADGDGLNDVDAFASYANLQEALAGDFATGAGRLLILMLDHGYRTQDFMAFRLNPTEGLPAPTMDGWLDALQNSAPVDVTLVVDSCYSGEFVTACAGAPTDRSRIVISSTEANSEAVFLPPPDLSSFMYQFLGSAYMGNSIGEAFRNADQFFQTFPVSQQRPQIDDGGAPGIDNANNEFFGATWAYGVQSTTDINQFFPVFDYVTTSTVVASAPVPLVARTLPGVSPTGVTAVIRPPGPAVVTGDPVANLPRIELVRNGSDPQLWEATGTTQFALPGAHVVSFTARMPNERLSNPAFSTISISSGIDPDQTPIRAIVAAGDGTTAALDGAFEGIAALAKNIYEKRFQDNLGALHPEWVRTYTPSTTMPVSSSQILADIEIWALSEFATDGRLFVHLVGEATVGGALRIGAADSLSALDLGNALDALQAARPAVEIVVILDMPGAEEFLGALSPLPTQSRVLMLSSGLGENGLFLTAAPYTSFSQKFLSACYQGNTLRDGFRSARNFLRVFMANTITPKLEDDGNGLPDKFDGALAGARWLGRRYAFAGDDPSGLPFIVDVTGPQTTSRNIYVTYWIDTLRNVNATRAFMVLRGPGDLGADVSALPEYAMTPDGSVPGRWTVTFRAPDELGLHQLSFQAAYDNGTEEKLSDAAFSSLNVAVGAATATNWMHYD